jgi:hypothetical protein
VRHLIRSPRVRRAFVWSCVPYLLLSLFADFLHGHPLLNPDAPAIGIVHHVPSAAAPRPHKLPGAPCAICQMQRVRTRLQAGTARTSATIPDPTLLASVSVAVPKSPVPHPSAFRGPPRTFVS